MYCCGLVLPWQLIGAHTSAISELMWQTVSYRGVALDLSLNGVGPEGPLRCQVWEEGGVYAGLCYSIGAGAGI